MVREIWKDVVGYENLLSISNNGKVFNKKNNKIMKYFLSGRGYKTISVWFGKRSNRKNFLIHRLVAQTFIPNPLNKPQINHKDGNKLNNRVDNLEWCDARYNNIHAIRNGLRNYNDRKKKVAQIKNGIVIKIYSSVAQAMKETNIKNIYDCTRNKKHCKSAGGFQWKYL